MKTSVILTTEAPLPIGPYSQAILAGDLVYVSGQIGINPKTGDLETETLEKEVKQALENLSKVLQAAKTSFDNIIKASIFLKDMNHFSQINQWYASYFNGDVFPARETIEVSRLPKDARFEISVIAKVG